MSWLLDTNAVSELQIKKINHGFREWWSSLNQSLEDVFLCAPVLGELIRGALLPRVSVSKRQLLLNWIDRDLSDAFGDRILPFDKAVARTWGEVAASIPRARVLPALDSYVAAIAIHHDLILVTRNISDMAVFKGLKVHSPWS